MIFNDKEIIAEIERINRLEDMIYKLLDYFNLVYNITPQQTEKTEIRKLTKKEKENLKKKEIVLPPPNDGEIVTKP